MLLEFKMKNVYSFKDEICFTMLAPSGKVKKRYSENFSTICGYDILKTALIVGENAGGKSNFIKGMQYFKGFFKETSNIVFSDKSTYFYGENDEQGFSIITTDGTSVFYYDLVICKYGIKNETLSYSKGKKKTVINIFSYNAKPENCNEKATFDIPSNHDLEKRFIETIDDKLNKGLIVSYLSILGISKAAEFINTINKIEVQMNFLDSSSTLNYPFERKLNEKDFGIMEKTEFIEIFKLVDSSIEGIIVDKERTFTNSRIIRKTDANIERSNYIYADSTGVKNFLLFSLIIYKVVHEGLISFNDEMDSTFNPVLTSKVISYINSCESKGQFIFTTHNIFNMNLQMFLKDQMYIVTKDKQTLESTMYCLSTFSDIRYDSNDKIYECYMKGLLGGIDNE